MDWWCWKTRWNLRGDWAALFISECLMDLLRFLPARNAWGRNLRFPESGSAINQLGSFQISPSDACRLLRWNYPKPGVTSLNRKDRSHTLRPLHMMLSGARNLIERSACGGKGLNNHIQLRNKIVHPRQPCSLVPVHTKSQHSRHRKIAPCTTNLRRNSLRASSSWIQSMIYKEISVSGSKHQLF